MRKILLSICVTTLTGSLWSANLIADPEFNQPIKAECRFDHNHGVLKWRQFTETQTGNKCLLMEVVKYHKKDDGTNSYYATVVIGGNEKISGFQVRPNTVYKFSIEIKGNTGNASIYTMEWIGDDFWKDRRKLKTEGTGKISPTHEWVVYSGKFQTGPNAKRAAIGITICGEERYNTLPPIGSYLLIDNVKIWR